MQARNNTPRITFCQRCRCVWTHPFLQPTRRARVLVILESCSRGPSRRRVGLPTPRIPLLPDLQRLQCQLLLSCQGGAALACRWLHG